LFIFAGQSYIKEVLKDENNILNSKKFYRGTHQLIHLGLMDPDSEMPSLVRSGKNKEIGYHFVDELGALSL
jgi:hypothetical protein